MITREEMKEIVVKIKRGEDPVNAMDDLAEKMVLLERLRDRLCVALSEHNHKPLVDAFLDFDALKLEWIKHYTTDDVVEAGLREWKNTTAEDLIKGGKP